MNGVRPFRYPVRLRPPGFLIVVLCGGCTLVHADTLVLKNGETLNGKLTSVSSNSVVFESENLGTITLARDKVHSFSSGAGASAAAVASSQPSRAAASTNDLAGAISQLRTNTQLKSKIEADYLQGASPEAKAKYEQLLSGLSDGSLNMQDLRREAKNAADQLRSFAKDNPDQTGLYGAYLEVLDNFLKETESEASKGEATTPKSPVPSPRTNAPVTPPKGPRI